MDRRRVPAAFRSQTLHDPATSFDRFGPRFLEPPAPSPSVDVRRHHGTRITHAQRGDCARRRHNRVRHTRFLFFFFYPYTRSRVYFFSNLCRRCGSPRSVPGRSDPPPPHLSRVHTHLPAFRLPKGGTATICFRFFVSSEPVRRPRSVEVKIEARRRRRFPPKNNVFEKPHNNGRYSYYYFS